MDTPTPSSSPELRRPLLLPSAKYNEKTSRKLQVLFTLKMLLLMLLALASAAILYGLVSSHRTITVNRFIKHVVSEETVIETTMSAEEDDKGITRKELERYLRSSLISPPTKYINQNGSKTLVAIVSDGKSGSTILAETLNQNPDVFYLFEPLHHPSIEAHPDDILEQIYFNCSFDSQLVRNVFWGYAATRNRWFRRYFKTHPRNLKFNQPQTQSIIRHCKESDVRAMKFIRMHDITLLERLFRRARCADDTEYACYLPKIVLLVRDPRAIMASRLKKRWVTSEPTEFRKATKKLCQEMRTKLQTSKHLPPTILTKIRYEDWISHPLMETEALYKFLNLPFTDVVKRRLEGLLMKDLHRRGKNFMIQDAIFGWKGVLTDAEANLIQVECADVIRYYAYHQTNR